MKYFLFSYRVLTKNLFTKCTKPVKSLPNDQFDRGIDRRSHRIAFEND